MAEIEDLKSFQCRFESDLHYHYAAVLQWQSGGTQNAQSIGSNPMCGTISLKKLYNFFNKSMPTSFNGKDATLRMLRYEFDSYSGYH